MGLVGTSTRSLLPSEFAIKVSFAPIVWSVTRSYVICPLTPGGLAPAGVTVNAVTMAMAARPVRVVRM
jgi:hypothetical protein